MGCGGDREKGPPEQKQKWEYITLEDFKNRSCWSPVAYVWLWVLGFFGVAVYGLDTFTAVNLLIFDQWSSQVQPWLPFKYSKWIFAICILLSWALCIYEWIRAWRTIKRGGVAASYMDPLAASLQCMRGQGFKRFLVFTELTKSKKGTDYVAFFVYFAFQGALRIMVCEGPRQVVNGLTLGSLFEQKLINQAATQDKPALEQFYLNLQALANDNLQQVFILGAMFFTLVIWVFSAICLAIAGILYLVFLWHYIPQRDGRLRIYCRRKIDRRLEKIVETKVQDAIEAENRMKEKAERKAELKRQKTGELPPPAAPTINRKPTLPQLDEDFKQADGLYRQNTTATQATVSTLPLYSSRPSTSQGTLQRQPTLPDLAMDSDRPDVPRNASGWSTTSYESDAPLLPNAGFAGGDSRSASPAPTYASRQASNASSFNRRPMPGRNFSQASSNGPLPPPPMGRMDTNGSQRSFSPMNQRGPPPSGRFPVRSNTNMSFTSEPSSAISSTSPVDNFGRPMAPSIRSVSNDPIRPIEHARQDSSVSYFSRPTASTPGPGLARQPTYGSQASSFSRPLPRNPSQASSFHRPFTPATPSGPLPAPANSYEMQAQPSYAPTGAQRQESNGSYTAFNPSLHSPSPTPAPQSSISMPPRSATVPNSNRVESGYGDILDDYGDGQGSSHPAPPQRSYTGGPGPHSGWQGGF